MIQELHLHPSAHMTVSEEGNLLHADLVGDTVSKMMIRSSLTSLTLHEDTAGFAPRYDLLFDHMTHDEAAIRLRTLTLRAPDKRVMKALARFLAKSSRMLELSIVFPYTSESLSFLLFSGVRQNGSLHSVVWELYKDADPPSWLLRLPTYCQRNKLLPKLLSQNCASLDGTYGAGQTNSCVVPSLFLVARRARRTAPNAVFVGLLGALGGDVVGRTLKTRSKRVLNTE
jgi:hypothetical protein